MPRALGWVPRGPFSLTLGVRNSIDNITLPMRASGMGLVNLVDCLLSPFLLEYRGFRGLDHLDVPLRYLFQLERVHPD